VSSVPAEAYDTFALAYDEALAASFWRGLRSLLDEVLASYPRPRHRAHLDVACGTGMALDYFRNQGFTSVGIDASLSMLSIARRRLPTIVASDMRQLALRSSFSRITSFYDSLNHLLTPADMLATFQEIRGVMDEESLFLFDMNHEEAYPAVWGTKEPYVSMTREHLLTMDTSYDAESRLGTAELRGWARVDGKKVPIAETRRQRMYTEGEITAALEQAGMLVRDVIQFDPFAREVTKGDRVKLLFVASAR